MIGGVVLLNVVWCNPLLVHEAIHVFAHLIVVDLVIDDSWDGDDGRLEVLIGYLWLGLGLIVLFFLVMVSIVVILIALVVVMVPAIALVLPRHCLLYCYLVASEMVE